MTSARDDAMTLTWHEPMAVEIIEEGRGSHVEPPLDQDWDKLTRLRWKAGTVLAEYGIAVKIVTGSYPDVYSMTIGNSSHSAYGYDEVWVFLNGIAAGARAAAPPSKKVAP